MLRGDGRDEPRRRPRLRPARAGDGRDARHERHADGPRRLPAGAADWRRRSSASTGSPADRDPVRALLQRVTRASVRVDGDDVGTDRARARRPARRRARRRRRDRRRRWPAGSSSCASSATTTGRTNRSLLDVGGEVLRRLAVHALRGHPARSAAWVHGRGGPGARRAALRAVRGGRASARAWASRPGGFGAEMAVELVNDGPFTIWLDTDDR